MATNRFDADRRELAASRKAVYPWTKSWLSKRFACPDGAEQHPDTCQIDFSGLKDELLRSEIPDDVRKNMAVVEPRHLRDLYIRCVKHPKRAGNMTPEELESVIRISRNNIHRWTTVDGGVSWARLAAEVRSETNVMISDDNLKNMFRIIVPSPTALQMSQQPSRLGKKRKRNGSLPGPARVPETTFSLAFSESNFLEAMPPSTLSETTHPDDSKAGGAFETETKSPRSAMILIEKYFEEMSRSCLLNS